jgi:hypothetical protein
MSLADYHTELLSTLLPTEEEEAIRRALTLKRAREAARLRKAEINAAAVAKSRSEEKARREAGIVAPNKANIRDALADAALHVLATGGPAADHVRTVLATVFTHHSGAPLTIEMNARAGRLKPKFGRTK